MGSARVCSRCPWEELCREASLPFPGSFSALPGMHGGARHGSGERPTPGSASAAAPAESSERSDWREAGAANAWGRREMWIEQQPTSDG